MDLNFIKSKLKELENNKSKKENQKSFLWKPEPGEQIIRIVPYIHDKNNPFKELYFHYEVGMNVISPVSFGQPDPVVEFAEKLEKAGNREDYKFAQKIKPKIRIFAPVLVRGKESEGVKFWSFGPSIYMELLKTIADPDYGDITNPMEGRDIVVEFKKADKPGSYPKTDIRIKPNISPLTSDKEVLKMIESTPVIENLWEEQSYEDLKEMLQNYLGKKESENSPVDTPSAAPENTTEIMSDFDKLFNS